MKNTKITILTLTLATFSGTSFALEAPADTIARLTQECKQQAKDYELEGEELKEFVVECIEELKAEEAIEDFEDEQYEDLPEEGMIKDEDEDESKLDE